MEDEIVEVNGEEKKPVEKPKKNKKLKQPKEKTYEIKELTPTQIVTELNKFVIGQDNAKKSVAIALRNRWRRKNVDDAIREEIMPNNIILIGPTGVGKTEIARRLARLSNAPFIKVEASKFTEVGYVGRDVESMIRELTDLGVTMVKEVKKAEVQKKAEYLAEERILDILVPPVKRKGTDEASQAQIGFNSQTDYEKEKEDNFRTREKFREMLAAGELDDRIIEVDVSSDGMPMMQVLGPIGLEDMGMNLQDIFGNLMPKKVRFYCANVNLKLTPKLVLAVLNVLDVNGVFTILSKNRRN